jgi:hypothetical protein
MTVATKEKQYETLAEFWPFYVSEHSKPLTRLLHFVGTTTLFIWLLVAVVRREARWLPLVVISPYAYAWVSHFFVEKNKPATFKYPLKSLISDFKMYGLMWQGKMEAEVAKYCSPEEV